VRIIAQLRLPWLGS